jgi:HlyD family secretion protein
MKKLAIILILAAGIVAAWLFLSRGSNTTNRILISGNIELTEINIAFKTSGRLVERTVTEGDAVQKGMTIARLDQDQLVHQLATQQAALRTAEAQLTQAQTAVQLQKETTDSDIQLKKADLAQAEARLEQLQAGSRPQEIQEAAAAVDSARAEADRASKDWERAQTLYKNEDISTSQFDQYRQRFEASAAALKQAQERLALVREGPRKEEIQAAQAQVARARAAVRMSEAGNLDVQRRREDVAARQADVERMRAQVALIQSQMQDTVAASPVDGVVLAKSADTGEILAPGTTVLTVGDIDHPWLRGYISESDLGRVKLGAKARVTTDSYPGKVYSGVVSFVSSTAEFTPKQIQTTDERVKLVYRIKIDIENPQRELKLNMPADAEILLNGG